MATAWIVITPEHLNDYSVGAKMNALRTAALAVGQTDPFPRVMADVVSTVRAQIGSNPKNQLSATANSIPPDIKTHVCWLIIQAMQGRLPGLKLSDEEKHMCEAAETYMKEVAKGTYLVGEPLDPVAPGLQSGGSIKVVTGGKRQFTRDKLAGL